MNPVATVAHKAGHVVLARDPPRGTVVATLLWALFGLTLGAVLLSVVFDGIVHFGLMPAAARYDTRVTMRLRSDVPDVQPFGVNLCLGPKRVPITSVDGVPTDSFAGRRALLDGIRRAGDRMVVTTWHDRLIFRHCAIRQTASGWKARELTSGLPIYLYGIADFTFDTLKLALLLGIAALLIRQCRRGPEPTLLAAGLLLLCFNDTMLSAMHIGLAWPAWLIVLSQLGWLAIYAGLAGFPDARFTTPLARFVLAGSAALAVAIIVMTALGELPYGSGYGRRAVAVGMGVANVLAVVAAYRRLRATRGAVNIIAHQQLRWAVLGFAIALVATLLNMGLRELGLLQLDGRPLIWWMVSFGDVVQFAAGPVGILVALTRFRLFDADAVISRSFVWGIALAVLIALGAGFSKAIQQFGAHYLDDSVGSWASGSLVALAAALLAPGLRWLDRAARKWFQPQLSTLVQRIRDALEELRWTGEVETIAEVVVRHSRRAIHAHVGAMVVDGRIVFVDGEAPERMTAWAAALADVSPEDEKLAQSIDPALPPLRVPLTGDGVGAIGWLLFGARPDGSLYGRDETKALEAIAQPVAYAVAFVRKRRGWFGTGTAPPLLA